MILSPNNNINFRFTANYKFLALSYSFTPKFAISRSTSALKGDTKSQDFSVNINLRKFQERIHFSNTKGYYLENTVDFKPPLSSQTQYVILSNFKTTFIKLESFYFENAKKYSFKLPRTQNEIQLKRAGSLVIPLTVAYASLGGNREDSLTLKELSRASINYSKASSSYTVFSGIGYAYNLVHHNFFLTTMVIPLVGIDKNKTTKQNNKEARNSSFCIGYQSEFSLGYNLKTWFGGIQATNSKWQLINSSTNYAERRSYVSIFLGYRFEEPKFLKKIF